MVKDVWWDNVIFREFAAHFISMSDEQVVRDIRESVVKVINLDESGDSFGANMVRRAKERLCGRHDVAVQNGTKGGRPRKDSVEDGARESQRRAGADSVRGTPLHSAPVRSSGPMPDDVQPVYDFAAAENLDPVDAYECWNVTVNERGGKTADGKRITNWKAYVRKWCATRASNREEA